MEKVFEGFAVVANVKHHQQGPGLSLATAARIVNLHDGEVGVANRKTGGAVFKVSLPWRADDVNHCGVWRGGPGRAAAR